MGVKLLIEGVGALVGLLDFLAQFSDLVQNLSRLRGVAIEGIVGNLGYGARRISCFYMMPMAISGSAVIVHLANAQRVGVRITCLAQTHQAVHQT
jgi:hypothetical protein